MSAGYRLKRRGGMRAGARGTRRRCVQALRLRLLAGGTRQRQAGLRPLRSGAPPGQEPQRLETPSAKTGPRWRLRLGDGSQPALRLGAGRADAYWPYRRASAPPPALPEGEGRTYVEAVREAFHGPACVQAGFDPADECRAADWHASGVPLETVHRAILLGCVRKSMSLLERPSAPPVRSLAYFEPLLREVQRERFPAA